MIRSDSQAIFVNELFLILEYRREKASDQSLLLTLVVGIRINFYGQILVPWLRGASLLVTAGFVRPRNHGF